MSTHETSAPPARGARSGGNGDAKPGARSVGGATGDENPSGAAQGEDLHALRRTLAEQVAELQWDLGGLAYEMAIRDHFRLDVLVRRAAKLQEVDAELGAVERIVRLEDAGAAGTCPQCGALHSRGALFCEQCGTRLMEVADADRRSAAATSQQPSAATPLAPGQFAPREPPAPSQPPGRFVTREVLPAGAPRPAEPAGAVSGVAKPPPPPPPGYVSPHTPPPLPNGGE